MFVWASAPRAIGLAIGTLVNVPGSYMYRAETPFASGTLKPLTGLLAGA